VISVEYLVVMHKKAMVKAIIKVIRETHYKEREENMVKKSTTYFIVDEQTSKQCATTRSVGIDFEYNWFTTVVKK
jgi:hypothetical protein